jgi:hypothetical protein
MVEISTPIWIKGSVVRYQPKHPHVMFTLEEREKDGRIQQWSVEGPNLARLHRMAVATDFLKPGDAIEVCGFVLKGPWSSPYFVHGHVLVMPDARMRHWGPYGKLDNCIRPDDRASKCSSEPDPCRRRGATVGNMSCSVAPAAVVDAINRQMATPAVVSVPSTNRCGGPGSIRKVRRARALVHCGRQLNGALGGSQYAGESSMDGPFPSHSASATREQRKGCGAIRGSRRKQGNLVGD